MRKVLVSFIALALAGCQGADRTPVPPPATGGSGGGGSGGSPSGGETGGTPAATGGTPAPSGGSGGEATGGSGSVDAASGPLPDAEAPAPNSDGGGAPAAADPGAPCPRCVRIFDGKTFDGWEAAKPVWSITADGAMRGQGMASRIAYTKADYGNVRLIFTSRMNPVNGDHLGVLFWGNRPTTPDKPEVNNAGWLQWMPNYGGLWSYYPPKDQTVPSTKVAPSPTDWTNWHQSELLLILDKGTLRGATDGKEVTRYTHPTPTERTNPMTRIIPGPIGMMRHGGGGSEYKDIWVEVEPTEDKLYTVK